MAGTSNRPISIALSLSGVGHLILFVALALFIGIKYDFAINNKPLSIQLLSEERNESPKTDANAKQPMIANTADNPIPTPTPKESPTQAELKSLDRTVDPPARTVETIHEPVSSPQHVAVTEPATPPALAIVAVNELSGRTPVIATTDVAEQVVVQPVDELRPEPKTVSLTAKQKKMLNQKIKKWTHSLSQMEHPEQELSWQHKGQQYTATIKRLPARDDTDIEQIVINVQTDVDGDKLSTEMRLKRLAFSSYTQFIHRWSPNVHAHNDVLVGRLHSNSEINVMSTRKIKPVFHGKVTTAARQVNMEKSHAWRNEIFQGGLETGVPKIVLPGQYVAFPEGSAIEDHQVQHFDADTSIRFYADGTYGWKQAGTALPEQRIIIGDDTRYLMGARKKTLSVSGVVNGKVLVYSPERIIIEDDLVYAHDPQTTPNGHNYLGLVSDKHIEIAAPDVTGPGDLTVHASIYAKRRFRVRNYAAGDNALLFIYGSLTAGTLSATEPRFRTKLQFDERLENKRSPGFPLTDRYELSSWDALWQLDPATESPEP